MRWGLLLGLLLAYLAIDARAVVVWRSDLSLWSHAAALAPSKLRPQLNLSKQLYALGREEEAIRLASRALHLDQERRSR
jgi:hypothetical protein